VTEEGGHVIACGETNRECLTFYWVVTDSNRY